jgi:AcrR family transcriptional regulator
MSDDMKQRIDIGTIAEAGAAQRPERADAAANRRLILRTAEALFAEHGVEAVTMADIAHAAGVGKGTLYRRFANKPELCLALMDEQMRTFQNETLAELQALTEQQQLCLVQLDSFLEALVHFTDSHLPLICEVQRAGLFSTGQDHESPHIWQHLTIKGLLQTAVQSGELSSQVDIEYAADALLAPLRATLFRFQREARGYSLARISAGLQDLARGLFELDK